MSSRPIAPELKTGLKRLCLGGDDDSVTACARRPVGRIATRDRDG
jgi:hypothetical protein